MVKSVNDKGKRGGGKKGETENWEMKKELIYTVL
jgi:hypothetical protein